MSGAQRCGRKLGKNQWAHLAFTVSEDHDHSKKDLLIGRRKDKKEKGKDRGYAALEGELAGGGAGHQVGAGQLTQRQVIFFLLLPEVHPSRKSQRPLSSPAPRARRSGKSRGTSLKKTRSTQRRSLPSPTRSRRKSGIRRRTVMSPRRRTRRRSARKRTRRLTRRTKRIRRASSCRSSRTTSPPRRKCWHLGIPSLGCPLAWRPNDPAATTAWTFPGCARLHRLPAGSPEV